MTSSKVFKRIFEKDVVYLYQFPALKTCRNLSPFSLKLETIFRVYNIPHEIIYTATKKPNNGGALPFIELNGQQIVDPDLIEMRVRKHFNVPQLSTEQEAQSVAISRMADNHLVYVLIRYKGAVPEFYSTILSMISLPGFIRPIFLFFMSRFLGYRIRLISKTAIGDFNEQELDEILHRDLKAIENLLADDKKFLFGDKVTCADATVFGQLASLYYPFDNHLRRVVDREFPRLRLYMEDVVKQVYPNDFTV